MRRFLKSLRESATWNRDVSFVLKAVVYALLILAVLHAFKPVLAPDPRADEVKDFAYQITSMHAGDVIEKLQHVDGKPSMLVVYASWCGYCRRMMPDIVALMREQQFNHIHPVFLSVDKHFSELSSYLVHNDYHKLVTPYIIGDDETKHLATLLQSAGSGFDGNIPYLGIFDEHGRLVAEIEGVADKEGILRLLSRVNG
jgi:thiol-disulfide isomerase/thioredoxin